MRREREGRTIRVLTYQPNPPGPTAISPTLLSQREYAALVQYLFTYVLLRHREDGNRMYAIMTVARK